MRAVVLTKYSSLFLYNSHLHKYPIKAGMFFVAAAFLFASPGLSEDTSQRGSRVGSFISRCWNAIFGLSQQSPKPQELKEPKKSDNTELNNPSTPSSAEGPLRRRFRSQVLRPQPKSATTTLDQAYFDRWRNILPLLLEIRIRDTLQLEALRTEFGGQQSDDEIYKIIDKVRSALMGDGENLGAYESLLAAMQTSHQLNLQKRHTAKQGHGGEKVPDRPILTRGTMKRIYETLNHILPESLQSDDTFDTQRRASWKVRADRPSSNDRGKRSDFTNLNSLFLSLLVPDKSKKSLADIQNIQKRLEELKPYPRFNKLMVAIWIDAYYIANGYSPSEILPHSSSNTLSISNPE